MDVKDLRIGNYVQCAAIKDVEPVIMVEIISSVNGVGSQKEDSDFFISNSHVPVLFASYCEGIPLTEEWLLDFGFIKKYEDCFERGKFILNSEFIMMDIDITIRLKYVHQLQNLYYILLGEELSY